MGARRTNRHNAYVCRVPARLGIHGQLSAKVERSPNGWDWQVLKEDGTVFKQGHNASWDDAISIATNCLNELLSEAGAPELIFNPENWIGKDLSNGIAEMRAPKGFGGRVSRMR
jgi:hypothetical protein